MTSRPARVWWVRVGAAVVGVLVASALIEWGCRHWYPQQLMAVEFSYNGWRHPPHVTIRHARRGLFDVTFRYNSWGMKDYEYNLEKPASGYRILVLGDSWGENLQVAIPDSFDNVLESRLNRMYAPRPIEVINASVYAYDTAQQLMYFRNEGHRLRPDLVILLWTGREGSPFARLGTDGSITFQEASYTWRQRVVRYARTLVRSHSHFLSFLIDRFRAGESEPRPRRARANPDLVSPDEVQLALFREAQRLVEASGARLLIVPVHSPEVPEPYRRLFEAQKMSYVDPGLVYPVEKDPLNVVAGYLNPRGNAAFADVLLHAVVPFLGTPQHARLGAAPLRLGQDVIMPSPWPSPASRSRFDVRSPPAAPSARSAPTRS